MHRFLLFWATTVLFLAIGLHSSTAADAVSDDRLQGKWEVSKTNDEGQKYKQIVEIRGDELHFTIVGEDGQTYIRAVGDLALEKAHDLHIMKVSNIKAGGPEGDLEPVNDDRVMVYQIGYNTLTLISNMEKQRDNQEPTLDVYRKAR